mgnify:CR=1 FL=1
MKIRDEEIIDYEQNKIRRTAVSLSDIELVKFILLYDGHRLYQCQVNRLTRDELIDMYCQIVFDRSSL